jgi:oligoribonuclease
MPVMPGSLDVESDRIVWVDCEMTGLDPDTDALLEVAVIVTDGDLNLVISWSIMTSGN